MRRDMLFDGAILTGTIYLIADLVDMAAHLSKALMSDH